jgi:O-antigen/teichoic acid export membrane protein
MKTPNDPSPRNAPRPKSFRAQIARSLGMRVSSAGLTFAMGLVVAHALNGNASAFGEYAQAIAWMSLLVIVAKLGFDTASLRYLAQYRSQGEHALLRGFVRTSRRYTLAASVVTACSLAGGTLLLREHLAGGVFWCTLFASLQLPLMAAIQLREASLLAFGRVISGQTSGVLLPIVMIGLVWTVPFLSGQELSSRAAVLLHLAGAGATLAVLSLQSRRLFVEPSARAAVEVRTAEWLQVASPLLLVQLLNLLQNSQSGTLMCGALVDSEAAGLYSAVARVSGVLFLGLQAINTIAAPTIASLYHSGQTAELQQFVKRCALASFGFGATFAIVMLVGGRTVLGLFGDEFLPGYVPMLVMVGGLTVGSAMGPVMQLLLMTGRQWDCILVFAANVGVCLTLGFVIIPEFGVLGAALTAALARIGSSLALVLVAHHRLGLWCIAGPLRATTAPVPEAPRAAA